MNTILKGAMIASMATLGLSLAACESKKEEATEKTADAVAEASDSAADAMDAKAGDMTGAAADKVESTADAVRAEGKDKAEAIKEAAEKKK